MFEIVDTVDLLKTTDASVWAREFIRIKGEIEAKGGKIDEGLMISWFANAIMSSQDNYRWGKEKELKESMNGIYGLTEDDYYRGMHDGLSYAFSVLNGSEYKFIDKPRKQNFFQKLLSYFN